VGGRAPPRAQGAGRGHISPPFPAWDNLQGGKGDAKGKGGGGPVKVGGARGGGINPRLRGAGMDPQGWLTRHQIKNRLGGPGSKNGGCRSGGPGNPTSIRSGGGGSFGPSGGGRAHRGARASRSAGGGRGPQVGDFQGRTRGISGGPRSFLGRTASPGGLRGKPFSRNRTSGKKRPGWAGWGDGRRFRPQRAVPGLGHRKPGGKGPGPLVVDSRGFWKVQGDGARVWFGTNPHRAGSIGNWGHIGFVGPKSGCLPITGPRARRDGGAARFVKGRGWPAGTHIQEPGRTTERGRAGRRDIGMGRGPNQ